MIDLHTHLLPNIDDGAASYEEAMQLAELLREQGVETALCTPHFDPSQITINDFTAKRAASLTLMKAPKIRLIPGSETLLHDFLFYYTDLSPLCVEHTKYLLLELPDQKRWESKMVQQLEHLIHYYGVIPIIAHIERYRPVRRRKRWMDRLRGAGCIIQCNAEFVIDKKTRRRAFRYLKKGYIDVLASDCHNIIQRPPRLAKAYEMIRNRFGEDFCQRLIDNSRQIVDGNLLRGRAHYLI
jgi:protein-tyrosine phosphatase